MNSIEYVNNIFHHPPGLILGHTRAFVVNLLIVLLSWILIIVRGAPVYEWSKACTHGCERLRARDRIPLSAPMFCEANPVVHLREMSVRHLLTKAYQ